MYMRPLMQLEHDYIPHIISRLCELLSMVETKLHLSIILFLNMFSKYKEHPNSKEDCAADGSECIHFMHIAKIANKNIFDGQVHQSVTTIHRKT